MSAQVDELKALVTGIGNDVTEIDGDVDEIIAKLANLSGGATADEVAELNSMLASLKERTAATAAKVPEPEV